MYRTSSLPGGRRSSQLRRISVAKAEVPPEKDGRNQSEGKRSLIPRPSGYSSRSSSMERDGVLASTSRLPRTTSEHDLEAVVKSVPRSRSSENLTTPKNAMKTPGSGYRYSKASTCKKSAKKDSRPLCDRDFQIIELSKVQKFLVSEGIIENHQVNEVRSTMSIKLFVHVMNGLLKKLFHSVNITTANYCEEITYYMKKLKYPGTLSRSFLLSAYTPHSWPHVLGLLSWLIQILPVGSRPLEHLLEDNVLESSDVHKFMSNIFRRYKEWNEREDYSFSEDKKFCDDIFKDKFDALDGEIAEVDQEVPYLEESARKIDQEINTLQKEHETAMNDLQHIEDKLQQTNKECTNLQLSLTNAKEEIKMLDQEIERLQSDESVAVSDSPEISVQHVEKILSEIVSAENKFKFQEQHEKELSNQIYSLDLCIARVKADIDKIKLERDTQIRECVVSGHLDLDKLNINLNCHHPDYEDQMKKYLDDLVAMSNQLKTQLQSIRNSNELEKSEVRKLSENAKQLQEEKAKGEEANRQLEKEIEKKKGLCSELEQNLKIVKAKLQEEKEDVSEAHQRLEAGKKRKELLLKEAELKEKKRKEDHEKYANILAEGAKALEEHIEWCRIKIREALE